MSPVADDDIDIDTHTSTMDSSDSPLRRKFSEPMHHLISSPSRSPALPAQEAKCSWCGKYLEVPDDDDDGLSRSQVLKEHIATVHPHIAKFSMYDGTADEEPEDDHSHESHDQPHELTAEPEDADLDAAEDAEGGSGIGAEGGEDPTHGGGAVAENTDAEGDGDAREEESDQLPGFSHERDAVSVDKRLHHFWNIHDPCEFSHDFDVGTEEVERTWNHAFNEAKRFKKRDASEFPDRPGPYRKQKVTKGEFLEMTPVDEFLTQLRDPESRTSGELYAITQNAALALKSWQDEYMAIDKLHKRATRYTLKPTANPRKLEMKEIFEDKKESALYGYKYDPKADKVGNQNPFIQGNFKPTTTQLRRIIAKAGPNNPNPDGWPSIRKFGLEHIPKLQDSPRKTHMPPKTTRKRKAAEIEASNLTEETEDAQTESQAADESPPKRRTRARANVSENATPPASRGTGRGRGRGRGAGRMASRVSEPLAPAPLSYTPTSAAQVPAAAVPQPAAGAEPPSVQSADALPDAAEIARRQKIANSKNPKRTEAMLNHWARFNREGRVRNPKRTKAQIEADRMADAAKKASETPKPGDRRRSAVPVPPLGPAAPVQPAPMPSLAARGSIAPYAPIDPRAVGHPYGPTPGQQLQQPPPQMPYHSPYAEYYMNPYGMPAAQLPGAQRHT